MLQRIQSLYMLFSAAFMVVAASTAYASIALPGQEVELSAFGVEDLKTSQEVLSTLPLSIIALLTSLIPFVSIFLYHHRKVQIRLLGFTEVLLLGQIAFMVIYLMVVKDSFPHSESAWNLRIGAPMPLVALILNGMAMYATFRDELLVRSLDRIR